MQCTLRQVASGRCPHTFAPRHRMRHRAPIPEDASQWNTRRRICLPVVETAMPENIAPSGLINWDLHKFRDSAHLSRHVIIQICKVHHANVGKLADRPSGANVFPKRPPWMSFPIQPFRKLLGHRLRWPFNRGTDQFRRFVQSPIPCFIRVGMVVEHAPHHISASPSAVSASNSS